MPTFSISLPVEDCDIVDREAEKNQRSRAGQVRLIIAEWLEKQREVKA